MADEQKQNISQPQAAGVSPAAKTAGGVYIRTMKSDIEAMQKKGATGAVVPALKSALPPLAGGIPPKPSILPVTPSSLLPKPLAPAIPAAPAVPSPVIPRPPIISAAPAAVLPPAPAKPALPPIAPVSIPRPVVPAPAIPSFIPTKPAAISPIPPIVPRPSVISTVPAAALPAEIPSEEGRERIIPLVKKIAFFGGIAVVVGGILGIMIYYFISPAAPLAPKTPSALFSVDDVKIIDLGYEPAAVLAEEIKTLAAEPLGAEKSFTQVLFKSETEACFTLKRNCVTESRYLEPEEIYDILGAAIPSYLAGATNSDFTLFVYNQEGSPRFGAVSIVSDSQAAFDELSGEESVMAGYWEPLIGAAAVSPEGYKESVYQNINIRYLNLPDPYLAIDYAAYPARNYIIFATSRESIFALIDRLFEMEGK